MQIEEAIEGLKNDVYGLKNFLTDTEKEIWQEAIDTVLNELEKKDKVINEMAGEMCYGVFKFKNVKQVKEYFYKKVE